MSTSVSLPHRVDLTPLQQDVQTLKQSLATPNSRARSCLQSLIEMFSWGAMFSLADSFMDTLLQMLGHVFSNLGDIMGSLF